MAHSKVGICNVSLAMLGEAAIRDFDESNKRARMCSVFYDLSRDLLLSKFDWPFARKYILLNNLPDETLPDGQYAYQLPNDCKTPRDIDALGNDVPWRIMSDKLICYIDSTIDVYLWYTAKEVNPALFTDTFADLLSLHIAMRICMPITQDKALAKEMREQYNIAQLGAWESDANIGSEYRAYDQRPENDDFINPDGDSYDAYDYTRFI